MGRAAMSDARPRRRDEASVGLVGVLTVATRGAAGPGEVLVSIRGGSETFLAWSDLPLPKGATVLVTDSRGERTVDVIEWSSPWDAGPDVPGGGES
jgi:hypothetical protein